MASLLTLQAPAKLNLYLHILDRRDDGYHLLESLVVFAELADELSISPADTLQLTVTGEFAAEAGAGEENLVLRAAELLRRETACMQGAALTLTKNIPVGGGLGGGSSDAAAALRGLNRFWQLGLSQYDLRNLAATLGADVPMCLDAVPAIARGIGEDLTPLVGELPTLHAVLVHPRKPLLTKDVYGAFQRSTIIAQWNYDPRQSAINFLNSLEPTRNHLQRPAIEIESSVAEILLTLETLQPAPGLVRMTGSGACCFALYADAESAERAAAFVSREHPHWWVKRTKLRASH